MIAMRHFEEHVQWSRGLLEDHIQWSRKLYEEHVRWTEEQRIKGSASQAASEDPIEQMDDGNAQDKSANNTSVDWIKSHIQESKAQLEGFIKCSRECLEEILSKK